MTTVQLGGSGITLGSTDEFGVEWSLQSQSDVWGDEADPREVVGERANAHGNWNATEFYDGRTWPLSVLVKAPDHESLHIARERFKTAIGGLTTTRLTSDEPGLGQRWGMWRRGKGGKWSETTPTLAVLSATLVADDPLIYGVAKSLTTGAPSSSGGMTWPATWPATWDANVTSGRMQLENEGTMPASILWTIRGPITNPYIVDTDRDLVLRTTNLTITAGDWLTIDTGTYRALANGDLQASRSDRVVGTFFDAVPGNAVTAGVTNVQFGGTGPGPGASLTAQWTPTWI